MTVAQLILLLQRMPDQDMPVMVVNNGGRHNEYQKIGVVGTGHLREQNADGDPDDYWNEQDELEPEDRIKEGHEHFKHQGKIVLIR